MTDDNTAAMTGAALWNISMTTVAADSVNQSADTAAHRFVWVAEAVIQPCVLAFGILTNSTSLLVLSKVKMNFIFKTCLVALAISDLCTCITGFIAMVMEVAMFDGEMPFGNWDVRAVATYVFFYSYMMFICSSGSIVILIALIRNTFIIAPMKARSYFNPRTTKIACGLAFLFTFLLFLPTSLNILYQSCFSETEAEICHNVFQAIPNIKKISTRYLFAISTLFGPVLILIYTGCFISIRVTVGRSVDALSSMTSDGKNKHRESTRKRSKAASRITRTLLIILIFDIICTLPTVIQAVGLLIAPTATVFDKTSVNYDVFDVMVEIFLNFRPTYNFWLYIFHHPEFRMRMRVMFTGRPDMRRRPSGYERSMSSSDYRTENTYISRESSTHGRPSIALVRTYSKQ
jgi:hypothetical protein